MTKLFASGFPRHLDEMQLAQLFAPFGDIELITILCDKATFKSKGTGFIHMKTEIGALEAIRALSGKQFRNSQMEVRFAGEKPVPAKQRPRPYR